MFSKILKIISAFPGAFVFHKKPKLLLHICCVGCGVHICETLKKDYDIILYFFNPNIFPKNEYEIRLEEAKKISKKYKLKLIEGKYDHGLWLDLIKGRESDPERGERCLLCYRYRMESAGRFAQELGADYFATTLTLSPHKDAKAISGIGNKLAEELNVVYLDKDFKKEDGFRKSCELSRKLGLYRQNYCGCEFSQPHTTKSITQKT